MIELNDIKEYLISSENEDSKRPLVYPFFKKLFGDKFKIESSACGADVWIEGKLLVELKSKQEQWLEGFYQALHYAKKGLTFSAICVITKDFIGVWKLSSLKNLPENINKLIELADA